MTIIVKPTLTESLQQDRRSRAESGAKVETLRQEEPRPAPTVHATIDVIPVDVAPGAIVLDAIRALGKSVPTLCYSDRMKPYGACRTCLVEHEGRKPIASCHTPVTDGAAYKTATPLLTRLRKNITELIVSDHPLEGLDCTANGRCELQSLAQDVGLRTPRYENPRTHSPPQDNSHPFIKLEMDKCIGCARCVRACDEVQGSFVLLMAGRGYDTRVIAGNDTGFEEANCVSCGQCAFECPVAALEEPGTRDHGLPDDVVTTTCSYCGVGCSLDVHVKDGQTVRITPSKEGSANLGHTCVKGRFAHQFAHSDDRLRTPLIKENGQFREASWDEALDLVASKLGGIVREYGPDAAAMISSSRCTNEENYLMQKFARVALTTNSIDNCSRVCHSPSAYALGQALGTGAGTNSFQDVFHSDVLMIVGANPTEAHPVFGARIKQAVLGGAKLIVLDPRNTELARMADVHIPLRPGSNVAVINALQHVLLSGGHLDADFIERCAEGLDDVKQTVAECTPEWAAEIAHVDAQVIRDAAAVYAAGSACQILWGLGVTEAGHGSNAVFGLINMAVMTGNIGRPGTGTCPIRGQNNVQGASDVGALPNVYSDYRPVTDPEARAEHAEAWGVEPPHNVGLRIPDMFDASHAGTLKAMYILAEDVAQSDPNTDHVVGALEMLDFLVVQEIFMNPTAELADVVLPGTTFLEKAGTFVNSDRRIQRVRAAMEPLEGTRIDAEITHEIARRMGVDLGFANEAGHVDPAKVMEELSRLSPKWRGVTYERLEEEGFLQWPCVDADDPGTEIVHRDGKFIRGKAKLTSTPWQEPGELPDDDYPWMLTTGRQLFHYNVGTMTRRTDLVKLHKAKEETLRLHPGDAKQVGVYTGDLVEVESRRGKVTVRAEVTRASNKGTVFMTFHFPESRTNLLIGDAADEYTGCPEYKVCAVKLRKIAEGDRGNGHSGESVAAG
ncbi:MAG: formate dehydrogenase subunit alpha [Gemmatimonadaceae bacterium]|nr:formate dehydrogenase subunit alpha [Gemmatimonadaceae bacterium]